MTDYDFDAAMSGRVPFSNSSSFNYTLADSGSDEHLTYDYESKSVPEIVAVVIVVVALSVITCAGNLLVIISFKVDAQLQTVSNYFLLSLSVADLTIGLVSMPLYSVYLLMGYWPLGHVVCDVWLSLDYTMSMASVANLLVISFDRYFSVTRPLTYRVRRTSGRAAAMIAGAWTVSTLLWTPWIVAWPHLEGERTVPPLECYVQFLKTNKYFTIMTATAAFYLPVLIMTVLYFRIYRETEKRKKGLAELQGGASGGSLPLLGGRFVRRCSSEIGKLKSQTTTTTLTMTEEPDESQTLSARCRRRLRLLVDAVRGRRGGNDVGALYSKCQSELRIIHEVPGEAKRAPLATSNSTSPRQLSGGSLSVVFQNESQAEQPSDVEVGRADGGETLKSSVTTTTTEVRVDVASECGSNVDQAPLINADDESSELERPRAAKSSVDVENESQLEQARLAGDDACHDPSAEITHVPQCLQTFIGERRPAMSLHRVALQACMAAKLSQAVKDRRERRRHQQEKKAERKAARTLSAVLLAFIVTWTPYNVFIIVEAFCTDCVHPTLYAIGKYVTISNDKYINTVSPKLPRSLFVEITHSMISPNLK